MEISLGQIPPQTSNTSKNSNLLNGLGELLTAHRHRTCDEGSQVDTASLIGSQAKMLENQ